MNNQQQNMYDGDKRIVPENALNVNAFDELKRHFESDYMTNADTLYKSLTELAQFIARSVLKRLYDASGNDVIRVMRYELERDIRTLQKTVRGTRAVCQTLMTLYKRQSQRC